MVKVMFDTGATYVMIPWNLAEVLGLEPELSKEKTEMITASGVEKVPIVTLEVLRVAGSEVGNVKVIVHDLPQKSYVDGLLGLSFLRHFDMRINFQEGYLLLE